MSYLAEYQQWPDTWSVPAPDAGKDFQVSDPFLPA
jgi:hypothetical protein